MGVRSFYAIPYFDNTEMGVRSFYAIPYFDNTSLSTQERSTPKRNYPEFRAGFYFCRRLIQFMQQVYYDRQLDLEYGAPRNRGWMNLFRRWSLSRMLRFTWTLTAGTYGARFQIFCEHHLGLESGEPEFINKPLEITATLHPECVRTHIEVRLNKREEATKKIWEEEAKKIGLHYYETRLIKEFIDAYAHHVDLKDYPENEDCSKTFKFQVFPLTLATENVIEEQADKDMDLNAGILITGPALKKSGGNTHEEEVDDEEKFESAILYFRIRPSMRNMDLARKAFLECRKHETLKNYRTNLIDELPPIDGKTKATWERRAYREVHSLNLENLNHCRWFSQMLQEELDDKERDCFDLE